MAESVVVKQQLLILSHGRRRRQIALALGIPINNDVVQRILAVRYRPASDSAGPSWLTALGHAKDSLWSLDQFGANRRS